MANVLALTLVLIVIAAGRNAGLVGAQSVPPSSSSCTSPLASMAPCLNFLQGGPNNTSPTQRCCTSLASVVKTSAACLCQLVISTNNSLGIPINQTRALSLPGACKITTPPLSRCNSSAVSNPPAAAPTAPAPAPAPSPVVSNPTPKANSPAPATSAAVPPTTTSATPPTTTPTTGGALSPPTTEVPTASTSAGSMTGVSMLIHVAGIMGSLTYIIFASI